MYHKTRICSSCGKTIQYTKYISWYMANKNNYSCADCGLSQRADKLKEIFSGNGNPFYGKKHSEETKQKLASVDKSYTQTQSFKHKTKVGMGDKFGKVGGDPYLFWLDKYGKEIADKKLKEMNSKKGLPGERNPMYGKPSPQGSGNGWKGWYNNIYFRSIRELMFLIYLFENDLQFENAECKEFAIQYTDVLGQTRNYFPDFFVADKLYEIKPKRLWNTPNIKLKKEAATEWCQEKGYQYVMIDPEIKLDKIKMLWEDGKIKWDRKYEERFIEKLNERK